MRIFSQDTNLRTILLSFYYGKINLNRLKFSNNPLLDVTIILKALFVLKYKPRKLVNRWNL